MFFQLLQVFIFVYLLIRKNVFEVIKKITLTVAENLSKWTFKEVKATKQLLITLRM